MYSLLHLVAASNNGDSSASDPKGFRLTTETNRRLPTPDRPEQSSNLLLAFASEATFDFMPRKNPLPFRSF
jgi:hypothetical protein